ncbi:alpha-mannosyltransferase [Kocuria flava]|uniref:D-inositol 3-phosphate glycosyltransferase n=1 Tax=Kocuria flava TaxID=446860 RepID=A0A0U3HVW3_9MICC|nr:glycosyltransferase family 1 protein [Kocuria flava]ALU39519.1 alpha-mannosyltransferase [Kocuria flava]GEO91923.1 glycosyl transferase [Kocuria flava]
MRVALVAEQFLPHMNGVTHSVLRVLEHLRARGHDAEVIAPSYGPAGSAPADLDGVPVHRLPALPLTGYPDVRVAGGTVARVRRLLERIGPDVVHAASPFVLGRRAVVAADQLGLPCVAVYQTDVPGYAAKYGAPFLEQLLWSRVRSMHELATLTLAPSTASVRQLAEHGVPDVRLWRRGVDAVRFAPAHRDERWRREVGGGRRLVGYVGRIAPEKQVEDLAAVADLPGTRLVVVGSGPEEEALRRRLPGAHFTGFLGGAQLARVMASLDVFVHPGEFETFCQTVQEAMASGVPVVATGRGGPVDLVDSSRTGWLYPPGDLGALRDRVADLTGDEAKRAAFGAAARAAVRGRTWEALGDELLGHYRDAAALRATGPRPAPPRTA